MDKRWQPTRRDHLLARLVGACFGGSMLITVGFVLVLLFASDPAAALLHHPVAVLLAAGVIAAFTTSGVCISKLGRGHIDADPQRLWWTSLICHGVILAVAVGSWGRVGLAIGLMEIISIVLHVAALAAARRPLMTSNHRVERP
jgi:hypothetical protein